MTTKKKATPKAKAMTKAEAKAAVAKTRAKGNDAEVGKVTALDPTQSVDKKASSKAKGKASKAKKAEDERERLDLAKLKTGDKVTVLEGTRCEWLKPGMVVEFRGVERKTLARIKHVDGKGKSTYTLVGSRNLQRAK